MNIQQKNEQPFTEQQRRLIDFCKAAGFGWRKFAESVEQSGKCSSKQEETLCIMKQRIDQYEAVKAGRFKSYGKNNISDCEIMSFGLHI
jgi:hypothetical protein